MGLSGLRVFGRSGTPVSPLTLGTMNFGEGSGSRQGGGLQGAPTGAEESIRIIHAALDAGITAVDTADVYSQGESEQVVGWALRGRRDDVFLATKFHGQMSSNPAHSGNSRRWTTQAVEGSLRRLQTDRIDLYQAHRPDYNTDVLETITTLNDLIRQGKILYYGMQAYLRAADVRPSEAVLDAIDDVVPPGTNFVERDAGAIVPSLEFAELRRRWRPSPGRCRAGRGCFSSHRPRCLPIMMWVRTLFTIGHGTASQAEFSSLLEAAGVTSLVDVRIGPGSRKHPHFGKDLMAQWLPDAGISYRWEQRLGGFRKLPPDSPDIALRNESFRAYAAYMRSADFTAAVAELIAAAETAPTAIMCSETVWWRCHRRLVADHCVLIAGVPVEHLMPPTKAMPHVPTRGVRVLGNYLRYDVQE